MQCTELPPLESVRYAIGEQLSLTAEQTTELDLTALMDLAAETARTSQEGANQFQQHFVPNF